MSKRSKTIEHIGLVKQITRSNILVQITNHSACAGCHAKSACNVSDTEEKILVITKPTHGYIVGEQVKVLLQQSLGFKALLYGYLLPLLVVLSSMVVLLTVGVHEGLSGLISLLLLGPYYLTLYIFRHRISKEFIFDIEKIT